MYSNIHAIELRFIIEHILNQNLIDEPQKQDLLKLYDIVVNQSCFTGNGVFFIKECFGSGGP